MIGIIGVVRLIDIVKKNAIMMNDSALAGQREHGSILVSKARQMRGFMGRLRWLTGLLVLVATAAGLARAEPLAITHVTIIDVENGRRRPDQTVIIRGDRIQTIGRSPESRIPAGARHIDGHGRFLIPGLWDMHVHAHRDGRWRWQWPLLRAYGVLGVRDAGSHLGTALALRATRDPMAPRIIWGSPIIDGPPPVNDFGLVAENPAAARILVQLIKDKGFAFVKVYDRLSPETHAAILAEARRLRLPVEGHVPLALSPVAVAQSGQRLIDHLTLVLESCIPGALQAAATAMQTTATAESLDLLAAPAVADGLNRQDEAACNAMMATLARHRVWQVPTLIQMQGWFRANAPDLAADPRLAMVPVSLASEWLHHSLAADPAVQDRGRAVFRAQMALLPRLAAAGVPLLAGTDASNEAWVVPGLSLHEELALFVDAGLTPLQALQAATLAPLRYQGKASRKPVIASGEPADLLLLEADPLVDIANTRRISDVIAGGQHHDASALERMKMAARQP